MPAPLRLRLDSAALVGNWRTLARLSGPAACGAAIKADGYGLGARAVARRLADAGCRDFFVASWDEAEALAGEDLPLAVLHGAREDDMPAALASDAKPVLSTEAQVARWRETGRVCDVMVDTGMNRLGVSPAAVAAGLLDGLVVETLHSHLACADEPGHPMNERQRIAFAGLAGRTGVGRMSLANSAGIALGQGYRFDLTRPGLALYGGIASPLLADAIRPVVAIEAAVLQRRRVRAGETVGYNATWTAPADTEVAILNMGYADGYTRRLSGLGHARLGDAMLPVLGSVSMDLVAVDVDAAPRIAEGDWADVSLILPEAATLAGLSQYEMLTGLGRRFARVWE